MGYYINPPDTTKEAFLFQHGRAVKDPSSLDTLDWDNSQELPVCLVQNGDFTAAGIAIDRREMLRFRDYPNDPRPKRWYMVSKANLKPYLEGTL